jgi:prophage regulatory protein
MTEALIGATIVSTSRSIKRNPQPLHVAQISDALLRLSTVEALTGWSRSTVFAKVKKGEFVAPIRLGARCTRFRAGDVQAWLASKAEGV